MWVAAILVATPISGQDISALKMMETEGGPPGFGRVVGAVIAPSGNLIVADMGATEVAEFSMDGHRVATIGRPGTGPGEFRSVLGVAVGDDGTVFVLDPPRVHRFAPDGSVEVVGLPNGENPFQLISGPGAVAVRSLRVTPSASHIVVRGLLPSLSESLLWESEIDLDGSGLHNARGTETCAQCPVAITSRHLFSSSPGPELSLHRRDDGPAVRLGLSADPVKLSDAEVEAQVQKNRRLPSRYQHDVPVYANPATWIGASSVDRILVMRPVGGGRSQLSVATAPFVEMWSVDLPTGHRPLSVTGTRLTTLSRGEYDQDIVSVFHLGNSND